MLPGTAYTPSNPNPGSPQERSRMSLHYTQAPNNTHNYPSAAGGNLSGHSVWNNPAPGASTSGNLGGVSLNDTLAQSRPQYQTGYLMSLAQGQAAATSGGPTRYEDAPLITTKAKINPAFARSSASDFGTESIFESSIHRHRENYDDEDGPPSSSVFDIVHDYQPNSFDHRLKPKRNTFGSSFRPATSPASNSAPSPPTASHPVLHVIVFGYPPSRYTSTVAFFQSLAEGGTSEVEASSDVENAFKIGYKQPLEAARAWRKNGETISGEGGRWMVGAKWADAQLAEQLLGSAVKSYSSYGSAQAEPNGLDTTDTMDTSPDPADMQVTRVGATHYDSSSTIGTPIKLAPSAAAFRRGGSDSAARKGAAAQSAGFATSTIATGSPAKGVIGQVSDLIFGW